MPAMIVHCGRFGMHWPGNTYLLGEAQQLEGAHLQRAGSVSLGKRTGLRPSRARVSQILRHCVPRAEISVAKLCSGRLASSFLRCFLC